MNETAAGDRTRRLKTQAVSAIVGLSLVLGIVQGELAGRLADPFLLSLLGNVALLALGFVWLHADGIEHSVRRSAGMNVGIALFALVFVPLYFMRTRAEGQRLAPVLGFLGLVVASVAASMLGVALVDLVAGGTVDPAGA